MVKGYDPILLEEQDITKWISENIDNFVLVLPDKKNILLKKSYFLNPHVNDIYLQCEIESGALMLNKTNKSKLYMLYYSNLFAFINSTLYSPYDETDYNVPTNKYMNLLLFTSQLIHKFSSLHDFATIST